MQKSPSLEILLLDRPPQRSHHIVTLRHPFGHHRGTTQRSTPRSEARALGRLVGVRAAPGLARPLRRRSLRGDRARRERRRRAATAWLTRVGAPGCGATSDRGRRLEVRDEHGGFARGKNVTYDAHLVWASPGKPRARASQRATVRRAGEARRSGGRGARLRRPPPEALLTSAVRSCSPAAPASTGCPQSSSTLQQAQSRTRLRGVAVEDWVCILRLDLSPDTTTHASRTGPSLHGTFLSCRSAAGGERRRRGGHQEGGAARADGRL